MKPFNLEEAKAGAELVTREGKPARILCYDFLRYKYTTESSHREILTAITDQDEKGTKFEMFAFHDTSGKATNIIPDREEQRYDLFIKEKKFEKYVAIYKNSMSIDDTERTAGATISNTKEEILQRFDDDTSFIAVAKIEWEE